MEKLRKLDIEFKKCKYEEKQFVVYQNCIILGILLYQHFINVSCVQVVKLVLQNFFYFKNDFRFNCGGN